MCLAIPMQVVSVKANHAVVEQEGVTREVRIDFLSDIAPGDFLLIHAGFAIERISPEDAEQTLELIRMIAHEIP